jgi:hypothetical protein
MNARSIPLVVFRLLVLGGVSLVLAGCAGYPVPHDPLSAGPFYVPTNHAGEAVLPDTMRRVVLLPVHTGETAGEETAATLDRILLTALQKQGRFEVVPLSREDCRRWFGATAYASTGVLPHEYVSKTAAKLGADAVIFVDLTNYRPYRPISVGFRAKLATASAVRIVWTYDEMVSAEVTGVANTARRHFLQTDRSGQPLDLSPTILQSPSRFAAFAAELMFQTLPPR